MKLYSILIIALVGLALFADQGQTKGGLGKGKTVKAATKEGIKQGSNLIDERKQRRQIYGFKNLARQVEQSFAIITITLSMYT
ncbi:hypothetical protein GQX74_014141 [Glossina fuscipes]|nr:hypothetical protein GQX74_014141 [Glossina fuscipes]